MILWQKFRISLLVLIFGSILLVLGKVILSPPKDKLASTSFVFPEAVTLPQWQLKASRPVLQPTEEDPELIAQRNYQYIQNNLLLDIEMRYVTVGDVNKLIKKYTEISSSAVVRQQKGIGFYGLGVDHKQAYLSACINPRSGSTFTKEQFHQQNQPSKQSWERLIPWLLGQEELKYTRRCLWAHLSIPLKDSSPEFAYQILEKVWFSWYQYWQSKLPES